MPTPLVAVLAAVRPEPGPARAWVERELTRPEYQRSLTDRFLSWLGDLWHELSLTALAASPLSTAAAVSALVVLAAALLLVAGRVRREPLRQARDGGSLVAQERSPEEHRAAADAALADGRYDAALVEAFRAVAARAVRRGVLDGRPGLTAHELAADLSPVFPDHAAELARAAVLFDVVFYGDQPASPADARSVLHLDEALRGARPARGTSAPQPVPAVPR